MTHQGYQTTLSNNSHNWLTYSRRSYDDQINSILVRFRRYLTRWWGTYLTFKSIFHKAPTSLKFDWEITLESVPETTQYLPMRITFLAQVNNGSLCGIHHWGREICLQTSWSTAQLASRELIDVLGTFYISGLRESLARESLTDTVFSSAAMVWSLRGHSKTEKWWDKVIIQCLICV